MRKGITFNTLKHCNTQQRTATYCNTLQRTATTCESDGAEEKGLACNTLQNITRHCNTLQHTATHCNTLQHTAAHCNTLQHTEKRCNTRQQISIHYTTPHHLGPHWTTLQHTETHCNTLQLPVILAGLLERAVSCLLHLSLIHPAHVGVCYSYVHDMTCLRAHLKIPINLAVKGDSTMTHMCATTRRYMCNDSFTCVTWHISYM